MPSEKRGHSFLDHEGFRLDLHIDSDNPENFYIQFVEDDFIVVYISVPRTWLKDAIMILEN